MSLPELDPRFDDLVRELRSARPVPPAELRARVAGLGAVPAVAPAPPRRRPLFALAALAALVVTATVGGLLVSRDSGRETAVRPPTPSPAELKSAPTPTPHGARVAPLSAQSKAATDAATTVAVPPFRPTDVRAAFRLHVADAHALADATQRAMRIVRGYGGYVVSAKTTQPGDGEADSILVLRVPVAHVQQAITRLTGLGEIQEQDVSLRDLGAPLKQTRTRVESLRAEIASYERTLATHLLDSARRSRIETQLAIARAKLRAAQVTEQALLRQARLAKVKLELTTRSDEAPPAPKQRGQAHRTLAHAWNVLGRELALVAAGVLVLLPLTIAVALALAGRRVWRRREEARLLSRATT